MSLIIDFLKDNLHAVTAAPLPFAIVLVVAVVMAYRLLAWHQAGEAKNLKAEKTSARVKDQHP